MVEGNHRIAAFSIAVYRRSIYANDVELSIVVAIDESHAATHRFHDVVLLLGGQLRNRKAHLWCDIHELRD